MLSIAIGLRRLIITLLAISAIVFGLEGWASAHAAPRVIHRAPVIVERYPVYDYRHHRGPPPWAPAHGYWDKHWRDHHWERGRWHWHHPR